MHLDLDDAVALAFLAAAALDVEGEAAGFVAARLGFGEAREPFADGREGAGVRRGVGARRAADGRLVDVDDLVEMFQAFDAVVGRRVFAGAVQLARNGLEKRVDEERGLAAAGDAGDAGEESLRDLGGDVLQVVAARADDFQAALGIGFAADLGRGDEAFAGEVFAGERVRVGHDLGGRALRHDLAAVDAGAGADVDDVIGGEDRVFVVLDDDHGVAEVAQVFERGQQAVVVALVQADGGFVEDVEHAGEAGADLDARRMRWLSPPDSVPEARESVR